jgi:hypothetical protein
VAYGVAYGPHNGPIPAVLSVEVVRLGNTSVFQVRRKVRLDTPPPVKRARIVLVSVGVVYEDRLGVDAVVWQNAGDDAGEEGQGELDPAHRAAAGVAART